jgi:hypothetical protein
MNNLSDRLDNPLAIGIAIILGLYSLLALLSPIFLAICAHELGKLRKINAELLAVMRLKR